jgi:hypothetical protein
VRAACGVQMAMKEARAKEQEFFKGHPSYKDLTNIGTGYLSDKLSHHLVNEIMRKLPKIQHYIDTRCASQRVIRLP